MERRGKLGIWLMEIVFMCGGILESTSPRFSQRADFFTYICFLCLVILVSYFISYFVNLVPFPFRRPQDEESCLLSCSCILRKVLHKDTPNHPIRMNLNFPTFQILATILFQYKIESRNHLTTPALKRLHHRRRTLRLHPRPLPLKNCHNRQLERPEYLHVTSRIPPLPPSPHNPGVLQKPRFHHLTNRTVRRSLLQLPHRTVSEARWSELQFNTDAGVIEEDVWDER